MTGRKRPRDHAASKRPEVKRLVIPFPRPGVLHYADDVFERVVPEKPSRRFRSAIIQNLSDDDFFMLIRAKF